MKPEQFIRKYGVGKAREVVEYRGSNCCMAQSYSPITRKYYSVVDDVLYFFSESANQFLKYADVISSTLDFVDLSDLKRLVESLDLIKFYDGIEKAKLKLAIGTCLSGRPPHPREVELRQAIRDHESIYGEE
ncbi:hypothetical protein ABUE25_00805 [Acinetobacter baumannii]|uniref:hypothetical protein n=1 Tax=Acinetobacter baumannii TaxID=470 RepID=UPI001F5087AB|nr:hypothetical protein [Acinetobacter baumannii]UNI12142.1 hypothetical protein L2M54_04220 [Acinetobacter baumannii]